MNDTENFTLIGLHKLSAECGDGLLPELLALCAVRDAGEAARSEWPAKEVSKKQPQASTVAHGNDNVIPIGPYLRARRKARG